MQGTVKENVLSISCLEIERSRTSTVDGNSARAVPEFTMVACIEYERKRRGLVGLTPA